MRQKPKHKRYSMMLKAGLPEGAVRQKMMTSGVSDADQAEFFGEGEGGGDDGASAPAPRPRRDTAAVTATCHEVRVRLREPRELPRNVGVAMAFSTSNQF